MCTSTCQCGHATLGAYKRWHVSLAIFVYFYLCNWLCLPLPLCVRLRVSADMLHWERTKDAKNLHLLHFGGGKTWDRWVCVRVRVCLRVWVYANVYAYRYGGGEIWAGSLSYVYVYVHMYMFAYVCVHAYVYVCACTHARAHERVSS